MLLRLYCCFWSRSYLSQAEDVSQYAELLMPVQATSLGLACAALDLPVTYAESASGLVPPAVAFHLLGKGGAIALTIMCVHAFHFLPYVH